MSEKPTYEQLERRNRELEKRLRIASSADNQNHYRKILDCSPSAIYTKDLGGRYTSVNKQFETLYGLKSDHVIGKTDFELFPPQVAENSTQNDKQVIQTGIPKEIEEHGPVNGQMHVFISTKYPLINKDGEIYGICGVSTDITDQKRTEAKLAEVNSDLKNYFDLSPFIIGKADLETGYFTEINSTATEILGYSVEELTSKSIIEFIHPEDRQQTTDEISEQIAGKRVEQFTNRYICKDGSHRSIAWYGTPADKMGEIIAIGLDITELKRIEEELRISEQKFRTLAENVPGLVLKYKLNPDGSDELLYVSKSVEDIFEVSQEDAFNNNKLLWNRIHRDDLEDYIKSIKTSAENLSLWEQEHRIHLPGERIKWLYTRGVPLQQDDGCIIWDTIALDITKQKKAEEDLRQSEKRYWELVKHAPAGLYEIDFINDKFITANDIACEYSGYTEKEILEMKPAELLTPKSAQHFFERLKRLFAGEKIPSNVEYQIKKKNGGTLWVELNVQFTYDSDKIKGATVVAHDISKRKRIEQQLRDNEEYLRVVLESIADEVYVHDLDGRFLLVNNAASQNTGYSRDELLQMHVGDINLYSVSRNDSMEYWAKAGDGSTAQFLAEHKRADGSTYPVEINLNRIQMSEGYVVIALARDITDRKQAEVEREQLLARLQTTLEATADGILVVDNNGKQVIFSGRFAKMWRIPDEILVNKDDDQMLAFVLDQLKDPDEFLARVKQLYANPEVKSFDTIEFRDGRIFERYSRPHRLNDQIIGRVWSFRDITKRKRAEDALKKSEAKYRLITENMAEIITTMDMDLNFTYVSPSIIKLRGFTVEEALEQKIDQIMTPESFQRLSKIFVEELSLEQTGTGDPGRSRIIELEEYKKDGSIIWVENTASFIRDSYQKPIGILSISRDITDRKKAEEALRTSHERFLTVLDSIDATIYVADMQNYEVLFMNKYMINSFGRDMTGEVCWKVFREESKPCSHCPVDKLLDKNGKPTGVYTWQGQNPITGNWYTNYDRAIEWTDGRLVKIQIATDITEMKQMEGQLRQAHKMESIGTLAGGIAHEFNNMLGIILGNTELAFDDIPDWNPAKDSLNEIKAASLRAKDVVRKLLSVARKTPESRKRIPIASIIKESLDLMRRTIPTTIDIRKNITCSTEMIMGDPTEISQVMINLCTNSVHAMTDESGVLDVSLDTKKLNRESALHYEDLKPGDYISLTVKDTGEGIEPAFMDRLFDPYFTTKDVDKGLGLGLSIVHGIVKKHDGAIKIESEIGKGTTVEILFPLMEERTKTVSEKLETPQMGTERILLVDDEPSIIKMVTQMLKRSGYEVNGETSSSSALKLFKEAPEQFDLVISDMAMPEMSGDRLAQEIKQIRREIPIILCTGHSDRIDENKAKGLGIDAFIMKPFSKKDILKTIQKVLVKTTSGNQC